MTVSQMVSEFHIGFHKFRSETDFSAVSSLGRLGFRNETLKVKPLTP